MSGPRKIVLATVLLLVLVLIFAWWGISSKMPSVNAKPDEAQSIAPLAERQSALPPSYPQLSLKTTSKEEALRIHIDRILRDPKYEWKFPIRFYGRVIDQSNEPVVGADVHFEWTDLSSKGTSESHVSTNASGVFSLEGVKGKRLLIRVTKAGYYDISRKENQTSFEFANPAEAIYYEPDPNHPVVFRMRKKGEMPELIVKKVKLSIAGQGSSGFLDFTSGTASSRAGQLKITAWKPTITNQQINAGKVFPLDWKIVVKFPMADCWSIKRPFPLRHPRMVMCPTLSLRSM